MGGNMNRIQTGIVSWLIDNAIEIHGGFQPETNHSPLKATMNKDASFTITPISNDTEA